MKNLIVRNLVLSNVVFLILALLPIFLKDAYTLHLAIMSMIYAIVASNWNLGFGFGGIFHAAQPAFFAVGAYASAFMALTYGLSPWMGLAVGGIAAVVASVIVGVPCLRVRGIYLILLTFAFHFLLLSSLSTEQVPLGGNLGLVMIPPLRIGSTLFASYSYIPSYYLVLIILFLSFTVIKVTINSRVGMALKSLRDAETYSICRGVNPYKYKLLTFVISSFFTGVIGAFYAHYLSVVSPSILGVGLLGFVLSCLVVGGVGTLYGPLLGSFALTFASEYLRVVEIYRNIIFGVIIILTLIFMPKGIVSVVEKAISKVRI